MSEHADTRTWSFLPRPGSAGYYVLLACIATFILGPLGGVTAAYMNFSIGFFIGGNVLAGILGSLVTLGYGPEGKHGANYMQSMAASVAGMSAMGVLVQAMVWLGMPPPPAWQLIAYFLCIGMFGVGVGMLYTPILVDQLKLTYPSGLAVANILRALTDRRVLRKSVGKLGGGIGGGIGLSFLVEKLPTIAATGFSAAMFGGGMIVGARVSTGQIFFGAYGRHITPWLRDHGYLGPNDPFRKIGFIFALGTILGAAVVDLALLARDAIAKVRAARTEAQTGPKTPVGRLFLWVAVWGTALAVIASQMMHVPLGWVFFAIAMSFVFVLINGISQGITDQNPISSAFVVTVLVMGKVGLRDPLIGLFGGSILLVACTLGVDMQQDRSTGARLGSDRRIQFRFQMLGVVMGAFLAVIMTRVFLEAYPILKLNSFAHPELRHTAEGARWQSAMTFKFVGVLDTLGSDNAKTLSVMYLGLVVGFVIQVIRKLLAASARYQTWRVASDRNKTIDFVLDAIVIASPYASSLGGFVELTSCLWFGLGGIVASIANFLEGRKKIHLSGSPGEGEALPEDMSSTSLVGGGLIAGESLFALVMGILGLIASGALAKIFGG